MPLVAVDGLAVGDGVGEGAQRVPEEPFAGLGPQLDGDVGGMVGELVAHGEPMDIVLPEP